VNVWPSPASAAPVGAPMNAGSATTDAEAARYPLLLTMEPE
jgi:hypothetical protein